MVETHNPYEAPSADLSAATPTGDLYTPVMLQALKDTKPWVRFLSILGFVFTGLMVLGGVVVIAMGAFAPDEGAGFMALAGLFYLVWAAVWFLPLIRLHQYANAIAQAAMGAGTPAIEHALLTQKSFWRIVGIVTIVIIGLYFLAIFAVVIATTVSALAS